MSSELTSVVDVVVSLPVVSESPPVVVSPLLVEVLVIAVVSVSAVVDAAVADVIVAPPLEVEPLVDVEASPDVPPASPLPSPSSVVRDVHATRHNPMASTIGGNATTRCAAPQNGHRAGPPSRCR